MIFSIEQQLNALLRHANRNNLKIVEFQILSGYKGDFVSVNGECVFAHLPPNKFGGYPYYTLKSLANKN